ncbi:hypothetical protein ACB092_10G148100 [Castanea dentata]
MQRLSRTGCPPDIVNEEDLTVGESEYPNFRKWNIPKISTKSVYDLNWTEKSIFFEYRARTKNLKYLHIGLVQVAVKPLTRKGIDASVLMCLRDTRFKKCNDSILGMITASLYDGPVYFDCYPDLALALDDPNIIKALTLNILTSGYDMDDGSRPFTLIYRIFYRLLDSQLTPRSRGRDPAGKTMLIQCSTPDVKIQVPKMIQWQDITLPKEWTLEQVTPPVKPVFDELDLTKIAQYTDGTIKIFFDDTKCFPTNKPLRINEGRNNDFFSKANRDKRKYYQSIFAQSEKDRIKRKWREKMNLLKQHILFFDYLENYYVSRNEVHTNYLNVIKKFAFVKHDKTVVKSSHPPLETVLITCENDKESTEVKASPFKIANDKTPVFAIIEQNNFTNESLHSKTFDLVNSQGSTVEKIEKMLADLKIKTEQTSTSRSTACAISRNEKEIVSDDDTNSDSLSFDSLKNVFYDGLSLPEIKRFVGKPNPTSFTKNWYSKPTPPDLQFEERSSQTQFSVSADKLFEWNIDGLSEQEIINKMAHMSMVGIAYINNHDNLDHPDIVDLLASGFTGSLRGWWDSHLTEESRDTPSNISSRIFDFLNNLRCPTMSDYRWYQDVFTSRVMLRKDSTKPHWKERFIDGLPPIFAHKVKNELIGKNDSIDFDNLTYAKYEMGNFCEQYGLPPIAPFKQKGKSKHDKVYKSYSHKKNKRYKTHFVKPNDFYAKNKSAFRKHDKQRSGKGKCFNCGKSGHFSKDCNQKLGKLRNKLNILNINNNDQNELFQILESAASTDSFEEDFSSSSDSDYHSHSDVSKSPNIKLGCRHSCCNVIKSVKMLTKSKENDDLLLTMISKIEDPNLQKDYLDKFVKNLTKEDKIKRPNSTISFEEILKRFNKNKSKDVIVNDLQHEIKTVKQEIIQLKNDVKTIKHDNDHLKQELLILKIDKTMDKHQSDDDEQKDRDESDQQASPFGNVFDRTLINLIDNQLSLVKHMLPKWYIKVKIVVAHDYAFDVVAMIDSGADVNCIQEGLIPSNILKNLLKD